MNWLLLALMGVGLGFAVLAFWYVEYRKRHVAGIVCLVLALAALLPATFIDPS